MVKKMTICLLVLTEIHRIHRIHERDRQTDRRADSQTAHDGTGRAYA